jgi:hypothetical protein
LIGGGGTWRDQVQTSPMHNMMTMALRRITTSTLLLCVLLSTTTNYAFAFTTKSYSPLSTPREYQQQQQQQQQQQHRIQKQQHCQQQFTLRAVFESSNNHERENNNNDNDSVSTNNSNTHNDITTPSSLPFTNPTSPEEVIQNQLYYYQHNALHMAYNNYCSPGNKAATGSYDEFVHLVNQPPYDLIVGHERADVLLELVDVKPPGETNYGMYGMIEDDDDDDDEDDDDEDDEDDEEEGMIDNINGKVLNVACCLVCIRPNKKARSTYPVWFWWEMSLVEEEGVNSSITSADDEWIGKSFELQTTTASTIDVVGGNNNNYNMNNSVGNDNNNIVYDYDDFASSTITAISNDELIVDDTTQSQQQQQQQQSRTSARWLVDCISPDFEDLDFETESLLSIEDFMNDDSEDGDDDDDEDGEYDDITIFLDY